MAMMRTPITLVLFWLLSWATVSAVHASQPLSFVTLDNFPPYAFVEDGQAAGIDVEIIRELARRTGLDIQIEFYPWKRVLNYVKTGKADGGFAAFKTPDREAWADFVDIPLHLSVYKIYVLKGKEFPFDTVDDLEGKLIGKNSGFKISQPWDQAEAEDRISIYESSMENNLKLLVSGRLKGVIGNTNEVGRWLKQKNMEDNIVALPKPVREPRGAYLMLSKESKVGGFEIIRETIESALKVMESEGTIQRINDRFSH